MRQRIPFPFDLPFSVFLGLELWHFEGGEAEIRLHTQPTMLNSLGMAHGGVVMTLHDVAMAHAARSVRGDKNEPSSAAVTIEMKTSFLQPAIGPLVATARIIHRTGRMAFCEGHVRDAQGALCSHATGTFKHLSAEPGSRPARS